jgi:hypothetical protein
VVGGTEAVTDAAGNRQSEVGWSGSGGGWSTDPVAFNVLPSYQAATGVPTNINYRLMPDVALNASGPTFGAYYFYYGGVLSSEFAGTSFASPVFAGGLVIAEQKIISFGGLPPDANGHRRFGRINDLFYSQNLRPDVWYDVTSGSNGPLPNGQTSSAGPGWDFVTGLGAIDFNSFALSQLPPTIVLPATATIYGGQGLSSTGGVGQLGVVDDSYFSIHSAPNSAGAVAAAQLVYKLPKPIADAVTMKLTLVADSPTATTNFLYLYNYATKTFDLLSTQAMNGADKTFTFQVTAYSSYVSSTNELTVVDRAVYPARLGSLPFELKLDQAILTIGFLIGS